MNGAKFSPMSETYDFTSNNPSESSKESAPSASRSGEPTILDRLRTELSKKIERAEILIEVPERPGVAIQISPNINQHQLRAWRRQSGENTKNGFDPTKFACYVIGHTCTGIFVDGEEALNENGAPLSFASPEILDMTDTTRPIPECVQEFFGIDPHVESAALVIMDAAGYGDEVEQVDPTRES
jgi:hypothetical protein